MRDGNIKQRIYEEVEWEWFVTFQGGRHATLVANTPTLAMSHADTAYPELTVLRLERGPMVVKAAAEVLVEDGRS